MRRCPFSTPPLALALAACDLADDSSHDTGVVVGGYSDGGSEDAGAADGESVYSEETDGGAEEGDTGGE